MSNLILPGQGETARDAGLTIIRKVEKPPAFRCRICKGAWTEDEFSAYQAHVVACADYHAETLDKLSPINRMPDLYSMENEAGEMHMWVQKHGRMPRDNSVASKRRRDRLQRERRKADG